MWKYIKLALLGKDAVVEYLKDTNDPHHPIWLHRRFVGAVITLACGIAGVFGYTIDANQVINAYWEAVPSLLAVYGVVLTVIGQIHKNNPDRKIAMSIAKASQRQMQATTILKQEQQKTSANDDIAKLIKENE